MTNRNKGFDPLSSLFEAPDPARGVPLPEEEDEEVVERAGAVGMTDPLYKRPAPPPPAPQPDPADVGEDKVALARRLAQEALARAAAPPAPVRPPAPAAESKPAPAAESKEELARRLAREALARAASPPPPAEDKAALARRLAQEALARAAAPPPVAPPPAGPTPEDKLALARKLAEEAQRKAAEEAQRKAAAAAPSKAARKQAQRSRVSALTERARKPTSALDAARAAARAEEERAAQELRRKENELGDVVQQLIPAWLPGLGAVYVANAIAVQQREVLAALWKGHRAKFLADGQLERAVGAAAVLAALENTPEGSLVAAHAVTDASDYLVWLDLDKRSLVAAFADARAYFAGG